MRSESMAEGPDQLRKLNARSLTCPNWRRTVDLQGPTRLLAIAEGR